MAASTRAEYEKKGERGAARGARDRNTRPADAQPRTGAKRTVMYYVKQLPAYIRLLMGLLTDKRVALLDKLLVLGAVSYIVMPIDLIPDFIPFLGEVDDLYLLVMSLQRLLGNAGRRVLLAHWSGDPADLADLNLRQALAAAAFFLPRRLRRRLRVIGR